jgi:hypothetical protein
VTKSFDFELEENDQVIASLQRIQAAIQNLQISLDQIRIGLQLVGQSSITGFAALGEKSQGVAKNAQGDKQSIDKSIPPLNTLTELNVGLNGLANVIERVKKGVVNFAEKGERIISNGKNSGATKEPVLRQTESVIEKGKAAAARYEFKGKTEVKMASASLDGLISQIETGMENLLAKIPQGKLDSATSRTNQDQLISDKINKDRGVQPQLSNTDKLALSIDVLTDSLRQKKQADSGVRDLALQFQQEVGGIQVNKPAMISKSDTLKPKITPQDAHGNVLPQKQDAGVEKSKSLGMVPQTAIVNPMLAHDYALEKLIGPLQLIGGEKDITSVPVPQSGKVNSKSKHNKTSKKVLPPEQNLKGLIGTSPVYDVSSFVDIQKQQVLSNKEEKYHLPTGLMNNIYQTESAGGKYLLSNKGAEGPFQFMPGTGRQYGLKTKADRMDFNKSSEAAAHYFSDLLREFHGNVREMIAAYNDGPGNISKHGLQHLPLETRNYIEKNMAGLNYYYPIPFKDRPSRHKNTHKPVSASSRDEVGFQPASLFRAPTNINATQARNKSNLYTSPQGIADAITLNSKMMQIELTLINSQTGKRNIITATGPKVTAAMSYA